MGTAGFGLFAALIALLAMLFQAPPAPSVPPRSLPAIHSRQEFDTLARTTDTPDALPHLLFLIDRKDGDRIYYINSKRYKFHRDFVNGAYLSLERGQEFFANNYLRPDRRFIMGTLAYRAPLRRWTFEFWEGDLISPEQIRLTAQAVNRTFFERVAFKPNSLRQEEALESLPGLDRVLESDLAREQPYQAINLARGVGRLHLIDRLDDHVEIGADEILVISEVPVSLPAVAGIDHPSVSMAALLQEGIDADSAGVMITTDPFDRDNKDAIYISAKRGLGIKVVEGKKIAEQLLFSPRTNAVQVLTR